MRREYDFLLAGYVLMPNHVHLLISEPKKCSPSSALQMLKQRVSRKMREQQHVVPLTPLGTPVGKHSGDMPGFWQPRFYDFNAYNHEKKNEKLDYMHANPVNRGLVRQPQDWPWRSWALYFKSESGSIAMDPVSLSKLRTKWPVIPNAAVRTPGTGSLGSNSAAQCRRCGRLN